MNNTQANIIALRRAGLSQVQIAQQVGTSQALISRWEAGTIPPALETANKIATLAASIEVDKHA